VGWTLDTTFHALWPILTVFSLLPNMIDRTYHKLYFGDFMTFIRSASLTNDNTNALIRVNPEIRCAHPLIILSSYFDSSKGPDRACYIG